MRVSLPSPASAVRMKFELVAQHIAALSTDVCAEDAYANRRAPADVCLSFMGQSRMPVCDASRRAGFRGYDRTHVSHSFGTEVVARTYPGAVTELSGMAD